MMAKTIDKIGRIIVDSLLLLLFLGIIALPASSVSLLKVAAPTTQVLSTSSYRGPQPASDFRPENPVNLVEVLDDVKETTETTMPMPEENILPPTP